MTHSSMLPEPSSGSSGQLPSMDVDISCKDLGKLVGPLDGGSNLSAELMLRPRLSLSLCDIRTPASLGFFLVAVSAEVQVHFVSSILFGLLIQSSTHLRSADLSPSSEDQVPWHSGRCREQSVHKAFWAHSIDNYTVRRHRD